MSKLGLRTHLMLLLGIVAVPLPQASAQEALEEITVTAQRREQSLQDVPISITAYTAELIEQNNMRGSKDYLQMTPNVAFSGIDDQGSKNGDIIIRGIGDLSAGRRERIITAKPAVAMNVDEFNVGAVASGAANPPLGDVARVEILRGPQGTFFGRNAVGGAINIITNKPDENGLVKLTAGIGNLGQWQIGGLVNAPLSDNLFFRGSAAYDQGDGMVENLSPIGNDSEFEFLNVRAALRWQPGDWTVDLTAQFVNDQEDNPGSIPTGLSPFGPVVGPFGGGDPASPALTCGVGADLFFQNGNDDKNCENQDTVIDTENTILTLRADYAAERVTFTSITGFIDSEMFQLDDLENTGLDIFYRTHDYTSESWSQEFRLTSANDWSIAGKPLNWVAGVFAYEDEFDVFNKIWTGVDSVVPFASFLSVPGDHPNENEQFVRRDGWAAFFDVSVDLSDTVTLSVGGRFSDDSDEQFWRNTFTSFPCGTRAVDPITGVPGPLALGCELRPDQVDPLPVYNVGGTDYVTGGRLPQNLQTDIETDGTDFSPRLAVSWAANDDNNVYFAWSQGYRPAGARVAPDSITDAVALSTGVYTGPETRSTWKKEKVNNYEIGWKGYLNDRRTQIDFAIFRMDWDDMVVRRSSFVCQLANGTFVDTRLPEAANCVGGPVPDNRVANADSARSQGVELTVNTLVGEQLRFAAAIGYNDSEFTDFRDAVLAGGTADITGTRVPMSPEWTLSGLAEYGWTIGSNIEAFVRLEGNYRSEVISNLDDALSTEFPAFSPSYTVWNLRAGMSWSNQRVNLSVSNLGDKRYAISSIDNSSGTGFAVKPNRRLINLNYIAEFDF